MKKIISTLILFSMLQVAANAEVVMYNTNTHKYHKTWCKWAKRCTVNCIKIEKKEAIKRGGVPCKVCGG
jgi:rRNA maturation endonuclease Nob1